MSLLRKLPYTEILAGTGVVGGFLAYYLPNTLYLEAYKNVTQSYRNGLPIGLRKNVLELANNVMTAMALDQKEREKVSFYCGFGFDFFSAGSTSYGSRGIIGIPITFNYSDTDKLPTHDIKLHQHSIDWNSSDGISLESSLRLSENARKFALAREISFMNKNNFLLKGAFTASTVLFAYITFRRISTLIALKKGSRMAKGILFCIVSSMFSVFWCLFQDMYQCENEHASDELASGIGKLYAEGGVEFYEKIIQRNIALRSLLNEKGAKMFTAHGNDQVFIRTHHVPYSQRKDYLVTRLKEYETS